MAPTMRSTSPVIFGNSPLRLYVSVQQPLQRWIEGAFADLKNVFRYGFQMLRGTIAVHSSAGDRFEDQQVERAGKKFGGFIGSHRLSMGV